LHQLERNETKKKAGEELPPPAQLHR